MILFFRKAMLSSLGLVGIVLFAFALLDLVR